MTRYLLIAALCIPSAASAQAAGRTHGDLAALYREFTQFRIPEVREGVPDYTPAAMARKHEGIRGLLRRLAAVDTTGWRIADRVDYMVVKAEMNAMEFDHRVLRPWSRDPAFYVVVNFQFGPKMYGASGLPQVPVPADRLEATRQRLRAIPAILDQARANLTEPAADLAMLGVRTKNREEGLLVRFIEQVREQQPALVPEAERALTAVRGYRAWLAAKQPSITTKAGIGKENYTWFMQNVMMLPYTWQELETITRRDLGRALGTMALEEHRARKLPPLQIPRSADEYAARHVAAQQTLLDYLKNEEILTVPEYMRVGAAGAFNPTLPFDYFPNVNYRDPMPLMPHDLIAHTPDARRQQLDSRPIRGARRLYFVDGQRQDGFATAIEQMMMHLGILDDRPHARELAYNLLALREVRSRSDLFIHANEMSIKEAFQYNLDNTPKGWLPADSPTMWHDLELYLRQPGYGIGYSIGMAQIDELLGARAKQLGSKFVLKQFMDDFLNAGLIPISLIHWEMIGQMQNNVTRWSSSR